jgi:hypothetical protein
VVIGLKRDGLEKAKSAFFHPLGFSLEVLGACLKRKKTFVTDRVIHQVKVTIKLHRQQAFPQIGFSAGLG